MAGSCGRRCPWSVAPTPSVDLPVWQTSPVVRFFTAFILLLGAVHQAAAEDRIDPRWSFGWNGNLVVGRWMTATVFFENHEAGSYQVEIAALDSVGHTGRYVSPAVDLPAGPQRLSGVFQLGRLEGDFTARVLKNGQFFFKRLVRPGIDPDVPSVMKLSDRLFVIAGKPRGIDQLAHFDSEGEAARVVTALVPNAESLPTDALGYDGVHAVLIAGDQRLSESALSALLEWVRRGGRLIVSVPKDVAGWSTNPLRTRLPVAIASEPYIARELGSLEVFAGRNVRIPSPGRLPVARLETPDGRVLAGTRDEPLLASAALGLGEVTVLALDLTQSPLANWGGLDDFMARLLKVSNVAANNSQRRSQQVGQLTTTGISDLASQLVATQDHFQAVHRASPWLVMGWLLLYILIVGPIDYFLVHYVLRRPSLTWVTVLVSAVGFGWIAAKSAQSATPRAPLVKQLDVVDVDVAQQRAHHRTWLTHYAPVTTRADWKFVPISLPTSTATVATLNPFSAPEAAFGGMYRTPGSEWGRTDYSVEPQAGTAHRTPALERSTQQWVAQWFEDRVNLIDGELRADGLGRLTGSLTHHFSGSVQDWVLAYGSRAYRLQQDREDSRSLDWKPEVALSLDDRQMYQQDLRGFLTGSIARVDRKSERLTGTVHNIQTRYNPLDRDPLTVWQAITFHEESGAKSYTTLTNELLHTDDFSRQLELGRAVILGRLQALSRLTVQRDGTAVAAEELTVLVRLVIPVGRSTEIQRTLPKLDKIP